MPCYDPIDSGPYTVYEDNPKHIKRITHLEAALCAVFSDLVLRGMLDKVIETASLAGGINLRKIYEEHKKEDEKRLGEKLDTFSIQEQAVLLSLLLERTGDTKNE